CGWERGCGCERDGGADDRGAAVGRPEDWGGDGGGFIRASLACRPRCSRESWLRVFGSTVVRPGDGRACLASRVCREGCVCVPGPPSGRDGCVCVPGREGWTGVHCPPWLVSHSPLPRPGR